MDSLLPRGRDGPVGRLALTPFTISRPATLPCPQGVLSAVDGLLSRGRDGPVGRLQLAAFGVAAAWRLGRWGLLARYLQLAEAAEVEAAAAGAGAAAGGGGGGGAGAWALGPGEKWELDLGSLLSTLQVRERPGTVKGCLIDFATTPCCRRCRRGIVKGAAVWHVLWLAQVDAAG